MNSAHFSNTAALRNILFQRLEVLKLMISADSLCFQK